MGPPFAAQVGLGGANGNLLINDGESQSIGTMTFNLTNAPAGITNIAAFADTGFDANFFQFETVAAGTNTIVSNEAVFSISAPSAIPEPSSLIALCAIGGASVVRRRRR